MEQPVDEDQSWETRKSPHRVFSLWLNTVGAMLIVAGFIGVTLALASHHAASPAGPVGAPVTRMAQASGLDFEMQVTPGPYFLGELLKADLSLTNDSGTTYTLQGPSVAGPCGAAVYVYISDARSPQYQLPVDDMHSCPLMMSQLTPGQTITLHEFLPLSNSGTVTLQSGANFLKTIAGPDGSKSMTNGPSPLDGRWPSLTIAAAATPPLDREITLQREGTQVQIDAPTALAQLFYIYTVTCNAFQGGTVGTGNYAWQPISTTTLHEPNCGDYGNQVIQWSYAVSAPGYAIASGDVGT
jgi:hypothetical protein